MTKQGKKSKELQGKGSPPGPNPGYAVDPERVLARMKARMAQTQEQLILMEAAVDQLGADLHEKDQQIAELTERLAEYEKDREEGSDGEGDQEDRPADQGGGHHHPGGEEVEDRGGAGRQDPHPVG